MLLKATEHIPVIRVQDQEIAERNDTLAIEEPLEIRLQLGPAANHQLRNISVTMRTPGNDAELALGFLFTEGIIHSATDVDRSFSLSCNEAKENTITIALKESVDVDLQKLERHFYTTSSCGVCGKSSINSVKLIKGEVTTARYEIAVEASLLHQLPEKLRARQDVFEITGGLHASALFDDAGTLIYLKEDVGRHNALDKLIGDALINDRLPLNHHILVLSGRASFELIQKAAMAGIRIVAAVGAPSSLAVELAKECDITLVGFLRNNRFNIYSGKQRIIFN